jgi:hypothetical protein
LPPRPLAAEARSPLPSLLLLLLLSLPLLACCEPRRDERLADAEVEKAMEPSSTKEDS